MYTAAGNKNVCVMWLVKLQVCMARPIDLRYELHIVLVAKVGRE